MSNVYFVLGGPGAGKGTVCSRLAEEKKFCHLSAGDLLRAEVKRESEHGKLIQQIMKEGKLVPSEITVALLKNAIDEHPDVPGFLIDGFPRNIAQMELYEAKIGKPKLVLNFVCDQAVMTKRILARAATSGRVDDNEEALKKRFKTHEDECTPVITHYNGLNLVAEINSDQTVDEVYKSAVSALGF